MRRKYVDQVRLSLRIKYSAARAAVPLLLLCLLVPYRSLEASGITVFDASALAQQLIGYKTQIDTYSNQLTQTVNQVRQIQNQVAQLQGLYTQITQGATNLLTFRLNTLGDVLSLSSQLNSKLAYAQSIGNQLNSSVAQANAIYPQITGVVTGTTLQNLQAQWVAAQRSQAQAAIQMQSIQAAHATATASITRLTAEAAQTQGALQIGQAQAQLMAGQATTLLGIEAQLAIQGRTQALAAMQQAVIQEATATVHSQSFSEVPLDTPAQGRWLSVR